MVKSKRVRPRMARGSTRQEDNHQEKVSWIAERGDPNHPKPRNDVQRSDNIKNHHNMAFKARACAHENHEARHSHRSGEVGWCDRLVSMAA